MVFIYSLLDSNHSTTFLNRELDTDAIMKSGGLFQYLLTAAEFRPGKSYESMASLFTHEKKPLV